MKKASANLCVLCASVVNVPLFAASRSFASALACAAGSAPRLAVCYSDTRALVRRNAVNEPRIQRPLNERTFLRDRTRDRREAVMKEG